MDLEQFPKDDSKKSNEKTKSISTINIEISFILKKFWEFIQANSGYRWPFIGM